MLSRISTVVLSVLIMASGLFGQMVNGAPSNPVTNATTTGTVANELVSLTGANTAVVTTGGATGGVIGICDPNQGVCGSTASTQAYVARWGVIGCVFDGGITQNDYVQISATSGKCHDTGSTTFPTSGSQVIGFVFAPTNASAGTYNIWLMTMSEIHPSSAGGPSFNPQDISTIWFRDEFNAASQTNGIGTGDFSWIAYTLGGSYTAAKIQGAYPHLGIMALEGQSTTTANGSGMAIGNSPNGAGLLNNPSTHLFNGLWIVEPQNTANGQYKIGWALMNTFAGSGCFVKYDTTNSDTNWIARCFNGGTATDVSLGVAPSTSSWSKISIYATVAGTINFAVCNGDGCSLPTSGTGFACMNSGGTGGCTTSSQIPTSLVDFGMQAVNEGSTQAVLWVDFASFVLSSVGR